MAGAEERTEQAFKVRQVTRVRSNWNEEGQGEPGKLSLQLILDDGAEEYVLRPTAESAKGIELMLQMTGTVYFDLERKVLIFGNLSAD